MNTKVCPECGKTFEAKRSDAVCCSGKCRSTFNNKRKERQKQDLSVSLFRDIDDSSQNELEVSGSIDIKHLIEKIGSFEKHISRINEEIQLTDAKGENLNKEMTDLKQQMAALEMGEKLKLKNQTALTDYALYNNYLNVAYRTAKQKGDQFAKTRLVTVDDIQSKFNHEMKLEIQNYRSVLDAKLEKLDWELRLVQDQCDALIIKREQNNSKMAELHNELRFYEARILKYESLLTG